MSIDRSSHGIYEVEAPEDFGWGRGVWGAGRRAGGCSGLLRGKGGLGVFLAEEFPAWSEVITRDCLGCGAAGSLLLAEDAIGGYG